MAANLLKGEKVILKPDQGEKLKTDKYGRTLAYVYRVPDGMLVNLEIVRQGFGHAYRQFPHRFMDVFVEYEKRARGRARGCGAAVPMNNLERS